MTSNDKSGEYDIFIGGSIYPDPHYIFTYQPQKLEEIKDQCFIVLDTNALVAPYSVGEADVLDQCRKIYQRLIQQKRLFIPGQVAREFAKHRPGKLAEVYQQLSRKKETTPQIQSGKYPLLSSLESYQKMIELERQINTLIQEYQQTIGAVLKCVQNWYWDDPVSLLYRDFFTTDVVIEAALSHEMLEEDLKRRQIHAIPPGFKDVGKEDKGVGDLIIWHTILEIAEKRQESVIFVSSDEKADWFHRSEKIALYPRYELIDEYRRKSGGRSLHILKFSHFLKVFGASEKVVREVQQDEDKTRQTRGFKVYQEEIAVWEWAARKYPGKLIQSTMDVDVHFRMIEEEQNTTKGFIVLSLVPGHIFTPNLLASYSSYKRIAGVDELFVVLVVSREGVKATRDAFEPYLSKDEGVHYIIGFMDERNQFIEVFDL